VKHKQDAVSPEGGGVVRLWVRVQDTQGYSTLSIALFQSQSGPSGGLCWLGPPTLGV